MALAEARTAWQRTANRCFVQEDAKRAPKLACCPSTSSSTRQVDAEPASAADGQDNPTSGFVPLNRDPSYSKLSPDSRWWLQLQPNYGCQRGLTNELSNTLEAEMEAFRASLVSPTSKLSEVHLQNDADGAFAADTMNSEPSLDAHSRISATCIKKDSEVRKQELQSVHDKNAQELLKVEDAIESYELMEMDPVGCMVSKQANELCFDSASPWIGGEKTEPWWRTADRHELASFVAHRSHDLIENCDLPWPQNTHVKDPYSHTGCFDRDGIFTSSKAWKPQTVGRSTTVHTRGNFATGSARGVKWKSVEGQSHSCTDEPISDCTTHKEMTKRQTSEGGDPSKAQLLEALRHSQTRAREAEMAAKQACAEKEHIVKLFLRQASHLFAYKQLFQLLQLENLYFQIMNSKNQPISTLFPAVLPWVPHKTRKMRKSWQKTAKGKRAKRGHPRCGISKYAVVFALGLSLVGAGLLLGWTVGWMLPGW